MIRSNLRARNGLCAALPVGIVLILFAALRLQSGRFSTALLGLIALGAFAWALWQLRKAPRRALANPVCAVLAVLGAGAALPSLTALAGGWRLAALALAAAAYLFVVFCGAARGFESYDEIQDIPSESPTLSPAQAGWLAAGLTLFALGLIWTMCFPYVNSPDVEHQWRQIHGELRYTAVHALGHTLYLKLLLGIDESYVLVILVNILGVAALNGLFTACLVRRGAKPWHIMTLLALMLPQGAWMNICFSPLKDMPYAICLGFVTLLLMRWTDAPAAFEGRGVWRAAALGLTLAAMALFRLNGMLALVILGGWFLIAFARRRLWRQAAAMTLCAAVLMGGVYGYCFGPLNALNPPNGFSMQAVGSGLAAIVNDPGITQDELEEIGAILPVDWMREHYVRGDSTALLWTLSEDNDQWDENDRIFSNHFVLQLGEHRMEAALLYLKLLPKHLGVCVKDILANTRYMWQLLAPLFRPKYFYIGHGMLVMLLILAIASALRRGAGARILLPFAPAALNIASIVISAVTLEMRYVVPTAILFVPLLFYALTAPQSNPRRK